MKTKVIDLSSSGDRSSSKSGTGNNQKVDKAVSSTGGTEIGLIDFLSDNETRELDKRSALEAYYSSPPLQMAVSAIARGVSQVDYQWNDQASPTSWSLDYPAPSQDLSKQSFFEIVSSYLKLTGEAYILKKDALEMNLIPIPPHLIEDRDHDSDTFRIENLGFEFDDREYSKDELIIIRDHSLLDPFTEGRGEAQSCGYDVDITDAASEHTASYLENHARPDLLATIEGASDDELERFRESMRKKHGGAGNAGKIEAFAGADIKLEQMQSSFSDLGLTDLRKHSAKVIRQVFGIPPEIVGIVENSNRATIQAAEYLFKKNVVRPLSKKIIEAVNRQFIKPDLNEQFELELPNDIVPDDKEFKLKVMKEFPNAFQDNEVREIAGFDPLEEGQLEIDQEEGQSEQEQTEITREKKNDGDGVIQNKGPVIRKEDDETNDSKEINELEEVMNRGESRLARQLTQVTIDHKKAFKEVVRDQKPQSVSQFRRLKQTLESEFLPRYEKVMQKQSAWMQKKAAEVTFEQNESFQQILGENWQPRKFLSIQNNQRLSNRIEKDESDLPAGAIGAAISGGVRGREVFAENDFLTDANTGTIALTLSQASEEIFSRNQGHMSDQVAEILRQQTAAGELTQSQIKRIQESTIEDVASKATGPSVNSGRRDVLNEVVQRSGVEKAKATRDATLDENTCDSCENLDGERVVVGSDRYHKIKPPSKCDGGHRCRCVMDYDEVSFDIELTT